MNKDFTTIIIGGFAGSGSSAVVDLLREFRSVEYKDMEFRILTDPDGIFSLENHLVNNWTPYQADIAIKRFKKLVKTLSTKRRTPYFGQNYNHMLSPEFSTLSNQYIDSLISFSYIGKWFGIETASMYYARKINYHLNRLLPFIPKEIYTSLYKPIYISYPESKFLDITRQYLSALIGSTLKQETTHFILDEGFSSMHPTRITNYFESAKAIVIHRDPRDIYVNAMKYHFDFIPRELESFIKWHRFLQTQTEKHDHTNLLRINFEDLIIHYDDTLEKIISFLGFSKSCHKTPQKYLKPEESMKNIGLWKNYKNQQDIKRIESELSNYCFTQQ